MNPQGFVKILIRGKQFHNFWKMSQKHVNVVLASMVFLKLDVFYPLHIMAADLCHDTS